MNVAGYADLSRLFGGAAGLSPVVVTEAVPSGGWPMPGRANSLSLNFARWRWRRAKPGLMEAAVIAQTSAHDGEASAPAPEWRRGSSARPARPGPGGREAISTDLRLRRPRCLDDHGPAWRLLAASCWPSDASRSSSVIDLSGAAGWFKSDERPAADIRVRAVAHGGHFA